MIENQMQTTKHSLVIDAGRRSGSALVVTIVLTVLLSAIGVMFVLTSRIDEIGTSAVTDNRHLQSAVATAIELISERLVEDVPGVAGAEYYDYPGPADRWLASLEPIERPAGSQNYYWPRISDVDVNEITAAWWLRAEIEPDYDPNIAELAPADADGDGVSDSRWIKLPNITTDKGKPIYAAIRIVDHGAMINVNTAYIFDPNNSDGSSQTQIDLFGLSKRGVGNTLNDLDEMRGINPLAPTIDDYIADVIWPMAEPNSVFTYTPFDINDELKLRYRYILVYTKRTSRIEYLWQDGFHGQATLKVPRTSQSSLDTKPDYWFWKTNNAAPEPNQYDYRHIATTYNLDRIIQPDGARMVNVNTAEPNEIKDAMLSGISTAVVNRDAIAAQLAVNMVDYRDSDSQMSVIADANGIMHTGFETPCVYISELATNFVEVVPSVYAYSYAVELYKPYAADPVPDPNGEQWRLVIDPNKAVIKIDAWADDKSFYVIRKEDAGAPLPVDTSNSTVKDTVFLFDANDTVKLQRRAIDNNYYTVDSRTVPNAGSGWLEVDPNAYSIVRDISLHKCVRRMWNPNVSDPSLGNPNSYFSSDPNMIQAHPANKKFITVGDIGRLFKFPLPFTPGVFEEDVRLNVADSNNYSGIFRHLTAFDPEDHGQTGETRIKGRININTAPWFVIAQLPWIQYNAGGYDYQRAQAIVAYRDYSVSNPNIHPFESIGELMQIPEMRTLGSDNDNNLNSSAFRGPDPTDDMVLDDFEERDLIFSKISNLVTVRSDVFCAYILVRLGTDGPQKRVMAILDRSNVSSPTDRPKIVAVHPVPDPR